MRHKRAVWIIGRLVKALGDAAPVFWPGIGGTFVVITMAGFQEARSVARAHAGGNAARLMAAMIAAFTAAWIVGPLCGSLMVGTGGGFSAALLSAGALLLVRRQACPCFEAFVKPPQLANLSWLSR